MTDDELKRRAPDPRSIPTSPGERALFQAQEAAKDLAAQNDALRQRVAELERGEYICKNCGLRKDSEHVEAEF